VVNDRFAVDPRTLSEGDSEHLIAAFKQVGK
jgi:hypothetical protein